MANTDGRGRGRGRSGWVRWDEGTAREVLERWASSGKSLAEFARGEGLQVQRLARWRARLDVRPVPALVPVRVIGTDLPQRPGAHEAVDPIEILLPSGACVRVPADFDPGALHRVLVVLRASC